MAKRLYYAEIIVTGRAVCTNCGDARAPVGAPGWFIEVVVAGGQSEGPGNPAVEVSGIYCPVCKPEDDLPNG